MTTNVIVEGETAMRDYLITITTATLMALVLQYAAPPPSPHQQAALLLTTR